MTHFKLKLLICGVIFGASIFVIKIVNTETSVRLKINTKTTKCEKQIVPYKHFTFIPLLSFPGSGNTWLRYLVEQATGFYTTTVEHGDRNLASTFQLEFMHPLSGQAIMTKTHYFSYGKTWYPKVDEFRESNYCVFLLRNPLEAFLSEYTRWTYKNHTRKLTENYFQSSQHRRSFSKKCSKFMNNPVNGWVGVYKKALENRLSCKSGFHVIKYENLKNNPAGEVESLIKFLKFANNHADIEFRGECMGDLEGDFHRKTPVTPERNTLLKFLNQKDIKKFNLNLQYLSDMMKVKFSDDYFLKLSA